MHRVTPLLLTLPLATVGCAQLDDLRDTVEGITNRFVVEGLYVGVVAPDDDDIALALEDTDFGSGATVTAFLADASEVDEIEEAPIEGVEVSFLSSANGGMPMDEENDGKYVLDGDDGLSYAAGEQVAITSSFGGKNRKIAVQAPVAPDLDLGGAHTAGSPLAVDVRGQGFESAFVTVLDASTGDVTFTNTPSGIREFYELAHDGGGELVVEIPGSAFPHEALYAVGVAGIYISDVDDYEEVNTALSTFIAARYRFSAVCTLSDPLLCE